MAKLVLTNAYVSVNGVDISNHVSDVSIEGARSEVDVTSMGDVNQEIVLGLGDVTVNVTLFNDYAVGNIDQQMFALWQTNTPFTVGIRPVNAARSTSNPEYQMQALLPTYNPIAGGVGAAVSTPLSFRNAAQAGLTRLTA